MSNEFGSLYEANGRYILKFERFFPRKIEDVFQMVINPKSFSQWYPFATGDMELKIGGKIFFDDDEGTTYEGIITELKEPNAFSFREVDDLIDISLQEEDEGTRMIFRHMFDDASWAVQTATGWHRCLDVFGQIVSGEPIVWHDNASKLREIYREKFNIDGK